MNITPEQIPDEVVEAALAAFNEFRCPNPGSITRCSNDDQMKAALAAALPVLLGEPVGHVGKFAFDALNASRADEQNGFVELWMRPLSGACIALYTLPTPETPNER